MNNPDLEKIRGQLRRMAEQLVPSGSLIPTAVTMDHEGEIQLNGAPAENDDPKSISAAVRGLRSVFAGEAKAGKLKAYGLAFVTPADKSASPPQSESVACILEHECGDGFMVNCDFQIDAQGQIVWAEEISEPLHQEHRIWRADGSSPANPSRPNSKSALRGCLTLLFLFFILCLIVWSGIKHFHPRSKPSMTPVLMPATNDISAAGNLTILSATFGRDNKTADVTSRLIGLLKSKPDGFTADYKTLAADPAPGKKKLLTIEYQYQNTNYTFKIGGGSRLSYDALVQNAGP